MADSDPPVSSDSLPDDDPRIEQIVEAFVARLQSGEPGGIDQILADNPDLADILRKRLSFVQGVFSAAQASDSKGSDDGDGSAPTISLRPTSRGPKSRNRKQEYARRLDCPHCGNPIQLVQVESHEVTCRTCGSTVHLDGERTEGYQSAETASAYGRFEVIEVVGRGGFGIVFKARDTDLNRIVALKVPRVGYFVSDEDEERFAREARNTAKLRHPGIVPVLEVGRDHGLPFIVSEFIDGLTLADLVKDRKLKHREAAEMLMAVCEAIHYAHVQKVIHRDIKPSNILLDHQQRPFVTDFGLARSDEGEFTVTLDGQVLGTPAYMSPEQAAGTPHEISARSDVYSLGVVLYRLICGQLPFRGSKRMMIHQVIHEDPRIPRKINDYIPRDLETITLKAVAKEPAKRYTTAQDMADDLRRWLRGEPILARPVGRIERTVRWARRNRAVASLLASVFTLLVCVAVGSLLWGYREKRMHHDVQVARQRTTQQLARTFVNNGLSRMHDGQFARATPWLVAAMQLDDGHPSRQRVHRMRLASLFDHCPRLTGVFAGGSQVTAASYGPDHQRAVVGFRSGRVAILDATTGLVISEFKHANSVTSVAFNPAGDLVISSSLDHTVEVRRASSGQRLRTPLQHDEMVYDISVSPDGKQVVTACRDQRSLIWNLADEGPPVHALPHETDVKIARFSPDGRFVVTAAWRVSTHPCTVQMWDAATGMSVGEPMVHAQLVNEVAFNSSSSQLITACWDGTARIWDAATGKPTSPALQHEGEIAAVGFSADDTAAVTVAVDGHVRSWDATSGAADRLLFQTGEAVAAATFDRTGRFVAIAGQANNAQVWQLEGAYPIGPPLPHTATLEGVRLGNAGRRTMSYDNEGVVKFWDNLTIDMTAKTLRHEGELRRIRFSHSGRFLVSGGTDRVARLWDVATGRQIGETMTHIQTVLDVAFSPNDQLVATASVDETARIWDARTGVATSEPLTHGGWVKQIQFDPTGNKLLTGCEDGIVRVWDVDSGQLEFQLVHTDQITWAEFSPDGKWIASCSRDNTAKIWTVTGDLVATISHAETVMKCRFDAASQRLVTASQDDTLGVWQVPAGTRIGSPLPLRDSVWDAAFSPHGNQIVSSDFNGAATLWDVTTSTPRRLGVFSTYGKFARESIFDPRGELVVSRSKRPATGGSGRHNALGAAEVWDVATRDPVTPPLRHFAGDVNSVVFSPIEDLVATASADMQIRLWPLRVDRRPMEVLRAHAELLAGRRLDGGGNEIEVEPDDLVTRCNDLRALAQPTRTAEDDAAWQAYLEQTLALTVEASVD